MKKPLSRNSLAFAALFLGTPRWVFWAEGFVTASTARVYVLDNDGVTDSDFSICVIGPR
jgi:hypothetical protein